MENTAETGVLPSDPFSAKYEVNSNEEEFREGTKAVNGTGGGGVDDLPGKTTLDERDAEAGDVPHGNTEVEVKGDLFQSHAEKREVFQGNAEEEEELPRSQEEDILTPTGPVIQDVVMAEAEPEVEAEVIGSMEREDGYGGDEMTLSGSLEAGKQNNYQPDPYASPDDQPMPQETFPGNLPAAWPKEETAAPNQEFQHQQSSCVVAECPGTQDAFSNNVAMNQSEDVLLDEAEKGSAELPVLDADTIKLSEVDETFQNNEHESQIIVNGNQEIGGAEFVNNLMNIESEEPVASGSDRVLQPDTMVTTDENVHEVDPGTCDEGNDFDPIDVVVKANSEENLLGLEPGQTQSQRLDNEFVDDSLQDRQQIQQPCVPVADLEEDLMGAAIKSQSVGSSSDTDMNNENLENIEATATDQMPADIKIEKQEENLVTSKEAELLEKMSVPGSLQDTPHAERAIGEEEDLNVASDNLIEKQDDFLVSSKETESFERTGIHDSVPDQHPADISMENREDLIATSTEEVSLENTIGNDSFIDHPDGRSQVDAAPCDIEPGQSDSLNDTNSRLHENIIKDEAMTEVQHEAPEPKVEVSALPVHDIGDGLVEEVAIKEPDQEAVGQSTFIHGENNVAISLTNENNEDGIAIFDAHKEDNQKDFREERIQEDDGESTEVETTGAEFHSAKTKQEEEAETRDGEIGSEVLEQGETKQTSAHPEESGEDEVHERHNEEELIGAEIQTPELNREMGDFTDGEIGNEIKEPSAQLNEDNEQDLREQLLEDVKPETVVQEAGHPVAEYTQEAEIKDGQISKETLEGGTKEPSYAQPEEYGMENVQECQQEKDKEYTQLQEREFKVEEDQQEAMTETRDEISNQALEGETKDENYSLTDESFEENLQGRLLEDNKQNTKLQDAEVEAEMRDDKIGFNEAYSLKENPDLSEHPSENEVLMAQEQEKDIKGLPESKDTMLCAEDSLVQEKLDENIGESASLVPEPENMDMKSDTPAEVMCESHLDEGSEVMNYPSTSPDYLASDIRPDEAELNKELDQLMEPSAEDQQLQTSEDTLLISTDMAAPYYPERLVPSATPPNTPEVSSSCITPPESETEQLPSEPHVSGYYTTEGNLEVADINAAPEEQRDQTGEQVLYVSTVKENDSGKQEEAQQECIKPDVVTSAEEATPQKTEPATVPQSISEVKPVANNVGVPVAEIVSIPEVEPATAPENVPVNPTAIKPAPEPEKQKKAKPASPPKMQKIPISTGSKTPASKRSVPATSTATKAKAATSTRKAKKTDVPTAKEPEAPRQRKPPVPKQRKPAVPRAKSPVKPSLETQQTDKTKASSTTFSKSGVSPLAKKTEVTRGKSPSKSDTSSGKREQAKTPIKLSQRSGSSPQKPTTTATPTPGRSKTASPKVDSKRTESSPGKDKAKMSAMSAVKPKTFSTTTTTKTTKTEIKSSQSSPRKSADGESPRGRQSPQRGSKIGSLDNSKHVPGGGNVKIYSEKVKFNSVQSRCGSMANATHKPGGGRVKILNKSADFSKTAKSKIGSLDNAKHAAGGGNVKILSKSADYGKSAKSKVGSLDNAQHAPGGGKVKIENKKLEFSKKASSKVGSLDNATHKAGGGTLKIKTEKLEFKDKAAPKIGSKDNIKHKAGGGQVKIENKKLDFKDKASSKIGSKDNIEHQPGGGQVKISNEKLEFKDKAHSRVGSMDNATHKPGGGHVKIVDEKPDFTEHAHSKIGSLDHQHTEHNASHGKEVTDEHTFPAGTPPPDNDDAIH